MTAGTIANARALLEQVRFAEGEYLATMPFRALHEHDMRAGRYVVRGAVATPPPTSLGEHAQAVSRALRAALDARASAFAGQAVRFPIHDSLATFAQRTRKILAPMSDEAQAAIEALQPYHAIGGFVKGPLWLLRELDDASTPRIGGFLRAAEMGINTQRKVTLAGEPALTLGAFDDGATLAAVTWKVVGPDPKLDMFFRPEFRTAFATEGPARGRELLPLLEMLCEHVEYVVLPALEAAHPR